MGSRRRRLLSSGRGERDGLAWSSRTTASSLGTFQLADDLLERKRNAEDSNDQGRDIVSGSDEQFGDFAAEVLDELDGSRTVHESADTGNSK